jgi:GT2 family glycosyltransferase
MNVKYSFLIPYYKRGDLFKNTLNSYLMYYSNRTDYEIVLIEDYKNQINNEEHELLVSIIDEYSSKINFVYLKRPIEQTYNPSAHFNMAARESNGEFLLLTNPECMHQSDILCEFDLVFSSNPNVYIACACYDPILGWLDHSLYHNRLLHWCNAINKLDFFQLKGFDENYIHGIAFEDNDFVQKIIKSGMTIVRRDDIVILHQTHDRFENSELLDINAIYYNQKWGCT